MRPAGKNSLADIQSLQPELSINIDRVGVRGLRVPLRLKDRANGVQLTVATVGLGVNLPASRKGTHMSRFVEELEAWREELDCQSMRLLLGNLRDRLNATSAWAHFSFPYLMRKKAPNGGGCATMAYDCSITGELADNSLTFLLGIGVPVMTVCPCSKAISSEGAHSQRALVRIRARMINFVWLEEFIDLAENSASSSVYTLLKREDEKFVTEKAFSRPLFVEDVAREVASRLERHGDVLWFDVEVESMESIHNHNAFAYIESKK